MQTGVAKGLKVPCLFMITEVSIRCQKNPRRLVYAVYPRIPPPIHHWLLLLLLLLLCTSARLSSIASRAIATARICLASVSSSPTSDAMSCSIAGSDG